jgi:WD40 repeat protein
MINHIAFSPDGKTLATAGSDNTVSWYDVANGKLKAIFHGHGANVLCVEFSPDGKTLASSSWDFSVILSDLSSGEVQILNAPWLGDDSAAYITRLRFSPDGRELAGSAGDRVAVWDVATGTNTANHGRGYRPYHLSVSGLDQAIFSDGLLGVRSLAYCPSGKLLAFGVDGSSILMWEVNAVLGVKPWAVLAGVAAGLLFLVVAPGIRSRLAPVAKAMTPPPAPRPQLPRAEPMRPAATQDSSGMLCGMRDALFFVFIAVGLILVYSRRW